MTELAITHGLEIDERSRDEPRVSDRLTSAFRREELAGLRLATRGRTASLSVIALMLFFYNRRQRSSITKGSSQSLLPLALLTMRLGIAALTDSGRVTCSSFWTSRSSRMRSSCQIHCASAPSLRRRCNFGTAPSSTTS